MENNKLGTFLAEVSNWFWDDFVRAEGNDTYTSNQAAIFALVRACAMQKLDAIQLSLNRLDGKLKTPVRIEYPKVYYLFPLAKTLPLGVTPDDFPAVQQPIDFVLDKQVATIDADDLPSLGLRQTLAKMADLPRSLPRQIIEAAEKAHRAVQQLGPMPVEVPMVKSVMVAHLLLMSQQRNIKAIGEVFDSIDGKLVETVQVLGEDIYITSYAREAPLGATPNQNGVLQMEAAETQALWENKLRKEVPGG